MMDFFIIHCNDGLFRIGYKVEPEWENMKFGYFVTMCDPTFTLLNGQSVTNEFLRWEEAVMVVKLMKGKVPFSPPRE
jgi:hypothetical protein